MSEQYIIAHDMGTSSNKAVLVTTKGDIIDIARKPYPIFHPKPGFAEQDPQDWWQAVCETTRDVLKSSGISPDEIAGLTFSAQMQCLLPVDQHGEPLMNAISWLDARGADILKETLWTPPRVLGYNIFRIIQFLRITGGAPSHTGKDQIAKILWLQKYKPELFKRIHKFLDAKDYLIYQLTGNFITSVDLAVVWWLLDTRKNINKWDPALCKITGINVDQLSDVAESAQIVGHLHEKAAGKIGLNPGTPVINGTGDLSAAAVGSGALTEGKLHISLGTSSWVAGHFTHRKTDIVHYTGCIGSAHPSKYYLAMAHQETAGVCLEWIKSNILYFKDELLEETPVDDVFQLMDQWAGKSKPGAKGLFFTPWMFGERCPVDDDHIRAGLYNLSLHHSGADIVRAVFEGIALNTRWAMETLEHLYQPVQELNIIGGGAKSSIWCQIFADILNRKINQIENPQQAGAKGVALLASMTLGFIDSYEDIGHHIRIAKTFEPNFDNRQLYDQKFAAFKQLYKQNRKWFSKQNQA